MLMRYYPQGMRSRVRSHEEGAVLILSIFIIFLALAFAALLVDILRLEGVVAKLQAIRDAASVAATYELRTAKSGNYWRPLDVGNDSEDDLNARNGWDRVSMAFFATLNANRVSGLQQQTFQPCVGCPNGATGRSFPTGSSTGDPNYAFRSYSFDEVDITFERGVYERPSATAAKKFYSFDSHAAVINGSTLCTVLTGSDRPPSCVDPVTLRAYPVASIANAVQVTLTYKGASPVLANLLGWSFISDLEGASLSALD